MNNDVNTTGNVLDPSFDLDDILTGEIDRQQQAELARQRQKDGSAPQQQQTDPGATQKANELLAQQLAQQQARIDQLERERQQQRFPHQDGPSNQMGGLAPQQVATPTWEQQRETLNARALTDPAGVIFEMLDASNKALLQQMDTRLGSVAGTTVGLEIQNFRSAKAANDADFNVAAADFDKLFSEPKAQQALASMPPEQRRGALEMMYDACVTQGRRKVQVSAQNGEQRRQVPDYSTGVSFASGETESTNVTYQGKQLNSVQREILRSLTPDFKKAYPERVKAMLDDAAGE